MEISVLWSPEPKKIVGEKCLSEYKLLWLCGTQASAKSTGEILLKYLQNLYLRPE